MRNVHMRPRDKDEAACVHDLTARRSCWVDVWIDVKSGDVVEWPHVFLQVLIADLCRTYDSEETGHAEESEPGWITTLFSQEVARIPEIDGYERADDFTSFACSWKLVADGERRHCEHH